VESGVATDLKHKMAVQVLLGHEDHFHETHNPSYVWNAWQIARQLNLAIPDWVLTFIDQLATSEVTKRTRHTDAAERQAAALTQMTHAVEAHRKRVHIRNVAKSMGVDLAVSRRDRPNLTALARAAAKAHGVSVNRLLALYRSTGKTAAGVKKKHTPSS
jgi:hypothetical protein